MLRKPYNIWCKDDLEKIDFTFLKCLTYLTFCHFYIGRDGETVSQIGEEKKAATHLRYSFLSLFCVLFQF